MNINIVKEEISKNINRKVSIAVYGLRNRVNRYEGIIYKMYPNLFTVLVNGEEKSFNYRDVITGEVKIKYL
ncbi:MAG TPA: Veg family protein [Candidatus Onthocola stercoravium]|nr:Veg family protein [Candidatus Onthocola stercoravium]